MMLVHRECGLHQGLFLASVKVEIVANLRLALKLRQRFFCSSLKLSCADEWRIVDLAAAHFKGLAMFNAGDVLDVEGLVTGRK